MISSPAVVVDLTEIRAARRPPALFIPLVRPSELTAEALLALVNRVIAVLCEENALLAAGLPALPSDGEDSKVELSDRLAMVWAAARASTVPLGDDDAQALIEATARLTAAAKENAARLEVALAASRQRIDSALAVLGQRNRAAGA